jgi:hypothetical protein
VTKNTKVVLLVAMILVFLVVIIFIGRDLLFHRTFDCGDGPRRTIDIKSFTTQYSAYAVELEVNVADKAKISTKLNPVQLQQLSEAIQHVRLFWQSVVAGYNSCAINKTQYAQYGARFQVLENLAREINELTRISSLSQKETAKLATLIKEYGELAWKLSTE